MSQNILYGTPVEVEASIRRYTDDSLLSLPLLFNVSLLAFTRSHTHTKTIFYQCHPLINLMSLHRQSLQIIALLKFKHIPLSKEIASPK